MPISGAWTATDFPRLVYLVILGAAVVGWLIAENRQFAWQDRTRPDRLGPDRRWPDGRIRALGRYPQRHHAAPDGSRGWCGCQCATRRGRAFPSDAAGQRRAGRVSGRYRRKRHRSQPGRRESGGSRPGQASPSSVGRPRRTASSRRPIRTVDTINLGPVAFDRVGVAVNGGEMDGSLLGMSFLNRFSRLEISDNRLVLEP